MDLKDFLLKACQDKDVVDKLRSLVGEQAQNVGILVSQHVVNLPPQLLQPLYDALFDEVSRATEDEPTEELRNSFYFKFYIVVSKIYKQFLSLSLSLFVSRCKRQHKNADKKMRNDSDEAIIYAKPEDEVFHRLSLWSFSFPLQTRQPATHELRNYQFMGLVMAVEADKISIFRQELKSLIDES